MAGKLLLLLLSAAVGLLAGSAYNRLLTARKRYFAEYKRFLQYVHTDVDCRRTDIVTLAGAFDTNDPLLKKHLTEYTEGLKSGGRTLSRGSLTAGETEAVGRTLFAIGRVDAVTQLNELKAAVSDAEQRCAAAAARQEKYGGLAIKLGFMAGLALGILLL